uniref:Uncharacterized protein n=1 Tax=Octopus bimaculoides TaxID=37653 RepID=A0A0L8GX83_OCTBM
METIHLSLYSFTINFIMIKRERCTTDYRKHKGYNSTPNKNRNSSFSKQVLTAKFIKLVFFKI